MENAAGHFSSNVFYVLDISRGGKEILVATKVYLVVHEGSLLGA